MKSNGGNKNINSNKVVKCYYCNEIGHFKNDCPKLRNKGKKFVNKTTWKYRPPNSGDPHTKTVEGVEYHWCAKCGSGRWTTTHGTNEHKDGGGGMYNKGGVNNNGQRKGFGGGGRNKPETNLHAFATWGDWDEDDSSDEIVNNNNLRATETWSAEVDLGEENIQNWFYCGETCKWLLSILWGSLIAVWVVELVLRTIVYCKNFNKSKPIFEEK